MHGGKHHHGHSHDHDHDRPGEGHNHPARPQKVAQWQTPHLPEGEKRPDPQTAEPDLDLVERAFIEGFATAGDPTNFLRLAGVPFEGEAGDGQRLVLLRVETEAAVDLGSVTPHVGGGTFRYDPLPARMVSRRSKLKIVYFDGAELRLLSLSEAKNLAKP
jgi:hypothetical protein